MTPETEGQLLASLSKIERELEVLVSQVRSHGERLTRLECSSYTPLPANGSDPPGPRRSRHWSRHLAGLLVQLGFVAVFVFGGCLVLGRGHPVGWPEIAGLTVLGAVVAGVDLRQLRQWIGGGRGGGAVAATLVIAAAALIGG